MKTSPDAAERHGVRVPMASSGLGLILMQVGKTVHPHSTLGESIGMAAEIAHGSCTDVPPAKT